MISVKAVASRMCGGPSSSAIPSPRRDEDGESRINPPEMPEEEQKQALKSIEESYAAILKPYADLHIFDEAELAARIRMCLASEKRRWVYQSPPYFWRDGVKYKRPVPNPSYFPIATFSLDYLKDKKIIDVAKGAIKVHNKQVEEKSYNDKEVEESSRDAPKKNETVGKLKYRAVVYAGKGSTCAGISYDFVLVAKDLSTGLLDAYKVGVTVTRRKSEIVLRSLYPKIRKGTKVKDEIEVPTEEVQQTSTTSSRVKGKLTVKTSGRRVAPDQGILVCDGEQETKKFRQSHGSGSDVKLG